MDAGTPYSLLEILLLNVSRVFSRMFIGSLK